ncbi:cytochrome c oxidase subunit I, partial [Falsirhodobacter halotolerans]|uniref:cytochrome c oxidase subunit I n=1 Tax=Falsirhodobacter halotolerans TaxID=1146892 RepID=UPI001FD5E15E
MGFLSFGLWVHHMYATGIPHLSLSFFSIASALVALPTSVQIFTWLATMAKGRPRFSIPMLHVGGFFFVFICGGLSGVMLAMVPFDLQAHDTHFVVAHLHYVLMGGFVFPMMAAAYYWLPHITGRQPVQHMSHAAFWTIFAGFNVTFLGMHLTGLLGMTRRIHSYTDPLWEVLNFISSMGSFVMTIGFALLAIDLIMMIFFGRRFRRDPWGAGTLEWAMPTPPASYGFAAIPHVDGRADQIDVRTLGPRLAAGQGYLATPNADQETMGVDPMTGAPMQVIVLPTATYLPLVTAVLTGGVFLSLILKVYILAPVFAAGVVGMFLLWMRASAPAARVEAAPGLTLPNHRASGSPPSLWAMRFILTADATAFTSLLFGAGFLAISAPGWPPETWPGAGWIVAVPAAAAVLLALMPRGWAAVLAQVVLVAGLAWAVTRLSGMTEHAAAASLGVIGIYAAVHAVVGAVIAAATRGRVAADRRLSDLWQRYTALITLVAVGFPFALRLLAAGAA